jgi:hypothetical protein
VKGFDMMYRKFNALFLSLAIMLAMVAGICARPTRAAASPAVAGAHLLSALPASDFVVYIDTQRLWADAVPAFLATKPDLLVKMNSDLDKVKIETGIDPRSFDMVALGMSYGSSSARSLKTVVLVRGRFDASAIINAGFATSASRKMGFQQMSQEEYKGKTLYLIRPYGYKAPTTTTTTVSSSETEGAKATEGTKAAESARPVVAEPPPPSKTKIEEKAAPCPSNEPCLVASVAEPNRPRAERREDGKTAVTALDSNTIAAGDIESVRATIDAEAGGAHVDDELVQLATRNASALLGFSGKQPSFLIGNPGRNTNPQDPFAKPLESIQKYYGSFSASGTDTETSLNLRTETPEQAREIKELVNAFKLAEGASDKSAAPGMFPAFSGLLKTLTVTVEGNEVQMQFKLTQADIAPLFLHL